MGTDDRSVWPSWHDRRFGRRGFLAAAAAVSAGTLGTRQADVARAALAADGLHGVELRGMYLTSTDRQAEGR